MTDVDVSEYKALVSRLKDADKKLAAGVRKQLRELAKPVAAEVIREGTDTLPQRGGLADNILTARVKVTTNAAGMSLFLGGRGHRKGEGQLRQIDETGQIRHPVFGRFRTVTDRFGNTDVKKNPWAITKTTPHQFTAAFERHRDEVQDALGAEIEKVMRGLA